MIYTLTTNPSVDYHMDLWKRGLRPGEINRSDGEQAYPGGKGLNVSIVLSRLGLGSKALGFVGGHAGEFLCSLISDFGCSEDFIRLPEGETRINIKLDCDNETAVNGRGPLVDKESADLLMKQIRGTSSEDYIVLCGNVQENLKDIYAEICSSASGRVVVDTSGKALKDTFAHHPWLIKPNLDELCELFGETDRTEARVLQMMEECCRLGVQNVLVSLGGDGAILRTGTGEAYRAGIKAEKKILSTVGAGDSLLAGFLAGMIENPADTGAALLQACAAGTATACRTWLCEREDVEREKENIAVMRM